MTKKKQAEGNPEAAQSRKRGQETHDRIIDAAIRLLSRHGTPGVTHRSVADEAGVSLALTTYHFASKEDILRKVYFRLCDQEISRFRAIYKTTTNLTPDDIVDHVSTQAIREATEFREQSIAGFELMLEAFRSKELSAAVRLVFDEKIGFWRQTMTQMGSKKPDLDAQIMFCSVLGAFLVMMARGQVQSEISRTRKKIRHEFSSLLD